MKYIETLREGEKLGDIYLCKSRQSRSEKTKYTFIRKIFFYHLQYGTDQFDTWMIQNRRFGIHEIWNII